MDSVLIKSFIHSFDYSSISYGKNYRSIHANKIVIGDEVMAKTTTNYFWKQLYFSIFIAINIEED